MTRPAAINSSAARRLQIPVLARNRLRRTLPSVSTTTDIGVTLNAFFAGARLPDATFFDAFFEPAPDPADLGPGGLARGFRFLPSLGEGCAADFRRPLPGFRPGAGRPPWGLAILSAPPLAH
jgi:hypothetical protein